ncbi:MAG TPA: hypothetical protein VMT47_00950 [Polyangia bacterium]|nr:hypothetical protein [Polyangia bacterium]
MRYFRGVLPKKIVAAFALLLVGCSAGSAAPPAGHHCTKDADCYVGLDGGGLQGTIMFLTNLTGGYCTHTCTTDSNCCAVAGERPAGIKEVCAPLESAGQTYCCVSCAASDVGTTYDGGASDTTFCHSAAGSTFTCRSTGGGAANKKFCGP